jgi:serine/threonine protein kinase
VETEGAAVKTAEAVGSTVTVAETVVSSVGAADTEGVPVITTEAVGSTVTDAETVVSSVGAADIEGAAVRTTEAVGSTVTVAETVGAVRITTEPVATGDPAGSTATNTEAAVTSSGLITFLPAGNSIGKDTGLNARVAADDIQQNIYRMSTLNYRKYTAYVGMVRKTRRQHGSAYIYKGAYGCAFGNPPLKCQGEATRRNSRYISKALGQHHAEAELRSSEKFRTIDTAKRFFLYPEESCLLDKTSLIPANGADKCRTLNITARSTTSLLFSENGGTNLHKLLPDFDSWPAFFTSLATLFDGLALAHTHNVAHCDIKPSNIVSMKRDDGTYHTRFIDFGLSTNTTAPSENDMKVFTNEYVYWPFETRLYNAQYYGDNWRGTNKQVVVDKWMKELSYAKRFLPEFTYWDTDGDPKFDADQIDRVITSINMRSKLGVLESLDVYGLGITLAQVYHRLVHHVVKKIPESDEKYAEVPLKLTLASATNNDQIIQWHKEVQDRISIPLAALVYSMTHVIPARRPTLAVAKAAYVAILPAISALFIKTKLFKCLKPTGALGFNAVSNVNLHVSPNSTLGSAVSTLSPQSKDKSAKKHTT